MVLYNLRNKLAYQTIYFVCTVFEVLLFSGITYGWASIVIVFQQEGYFNYLCPQNATQTSNNRTSIDKWLTSKQNIYERIVCSQQNKRFNLVFNVAVAALCCSKFPIGLYIDKFGPRSGQILGCFLYVIGGLGLAFVTKETSNILFGIFILFCIGGGLIAVSKYQVCRYIYSDVRSLILSILHGTFDSSAVILVFFKLTWESGISLRDISLFYTVLTICLVSATTILLTPPHDKLKEEKRKDSITSDVIVDTNLNTDKAKVPDTLYKSIFSPLYILELMFMCFCQLRLWFFIGSLDELITTHFHEDKKTIGEYNTYFGYAQLCGILVGPLIGCLFDRNLLKCKVDNLDHKPLLDAPEKRRIKRIEDSIVPFFVTNLLCMLFALLSLAPWKWGLIPSFVFQVMTRGFLYSAHASYMAMTFRPESFATLYGLGIFVAGLFGLLEYPLYTIMYKFCGSDPFWVNLALLFLVLSTNTFPFYLMYYCRTSRRALDSALVKFDKESDEVFVRV